MICPIWCEDPAILSMADIASLTMRAEFSAPLRVSPIIRLASLARPAALATVAVISSSAAAVSSIVAACCSVRLERSSVACAISAEESRTMRVPSAISRIEPESAPRLALNSLRSVS
jgi:hypothetical protein